MNDEGMFRELVENSDDIRVVTDEDYKIQYVSSSITRYFGIEPITLLGKNISILISPEKIVSWQQYFANSTVTSFHEEIALTIGGKKTFFDLQVSSMADTSNGKSLILKLHDITAKKFKEEELIRSNLQLDQVIYKTTHDLKAPLRTAMGLISLAEKAPEHEKRQYLEMIKKSLLKLDSFIEEMNNFFRNEKLALQRDKLNIVEVLKEELANLQSPGEELKIDVRFEVEEKAEFYSDSMRVKTIVTNILSNAIKYSDPGKREPFIIISVFVNEEFCEIRIIDNGIGIEPQYQEKIFDLFFRATNHSQGTGLGLFIVKDTIEKLKGSIEVNSIAGKGTTFMIRIPNQIHQPAEVG